VDTLVKATEPPSTGLAARKKQRTRQQLAEAAAELFYERGYDATTIDDIAAAVDVSPRTFYRYFPTKEDLVVAIGETSIESFLAALGARAPEEPLLAAVGAAVDDALAPGWVDTSRVRSFMALIRDTPAFRARWVEEAYDNRHRLAAVIAGRTDGDATSLRNLLIAGAISMAINTAVQCWADQDAEPGPGDFVHRALAELALPLLPA
jgi:AcrR family transcriptional regulator